MTRVESIESQVKQLTAEELRTFRDWFADYCSNDPEFAEKMAKVEEIAGRYRNTLRALSE